MVREEVNKKDLKLTKICQSYGTSDPDALFPAIPAEVKNHAVRKPFFLLLLSFVAVLILIYAKIFYWRIAFVLFLNLARLREKEIIPRQKQVKSSSIGARFILVFHRCRRLEVATHIHISTFLPINSLFALCLF